MMVMLERRVGKRVVSLGVLEGINRAIGVESITGGLRRPRAYRVLRARGDENGVMRPSPWRLVMKIPKFRVNSRGLLRVVHRICDDVGQ